MHLQAIILDFDGVIADTERLHLRAFQDALAAAGLPLTDGDYFARHLGFEDADVFKAVARDAGVALDPARLAVMLASKAARYQALIADTPVLYPGVEERIREWSRHVPLAIASGSLRKEIEMILSRAGLSGCFAAIVSAGDVARGKPAPDGYLRALEALQVQQAPWSHRAEALCGDRRTDGEGGDSAAEQAGSPVAAHGHLSVAAQGFSPARIVVVEDSVWGLQAAKAAGMRTVGVTTNHPAERLAAADRIVPSVAALDLDMLDALVSDRR